MIGDMTVPYYGLLCLGRETKPLFSHILGIDSSLATSTLTDKSMNILSIGKPLTCPGIV